MSAQLEETTEELTEPPVIEPPVIEPSVIEPSETEETPGEPKVFDESYVKALRKESAGYREKAKRVDEMGARLHAALVTATGRLQDATDLPFDPAHLDDTEALATAIDALLTSKPHLASRKPSGFIHQGATPETGNGFSLAGMLRANAGG